MMMTNDADTKRLEEDFAQMRTQDLAPSEDLLNRIMLDADGVLAAPHAARDASGLASSRAGFAGGLVEAIGGWFGASGLVAATVAGVWIGAVQPDALGVVTGSFGTDLIEVPLLESDILTGMDG